MTGLLLLLAVLALALTGSRLFVIVGVATAICFLGFTEYDEGIVQLDRIVTKVEGLTGKNVFLSIPFFIASGAIMTKGGIAPRLTNLATALVGWMPGGLAVASVVACIVFAAISGNSPVTLVAVGSVMYPALVKSGYPKDFSIGIVTSAGSLGCMIPPAIAMLVYAISVQGSAAVDPADLFFAGLLPALFIAGLLAAYAVWVGTRVPGSRTPFDGAALARAFRESAWALTLPVLVLGGIYGGVFTPTEAGAVAFVASIVLSVLVYRDVAFGKLPAILAEAATLMGSLLLIVVLAFGLNDFLAEVDAPGVIRGWAQTADLSSWQFMLLTNLVLIVLGALMDSISATLVFAPILAPVAINHYGMDPIHFGVVFVVNMEIGYLAPPVATNLFVASAIFRQPFAFVARAILPTLGIICGALVVLMYVPTLSLGPLNLREGRPVYVGFPWDGKPAEVEAADAPAAPADAPAGGDAKPMTLEEMMRKAKEQAAQGDAPAAAPTGASEPAKPMTLEEMMRKAKEQVEQQDAQGAAGSAP
jgi:C4-dicarboxylate transporter DctM subunit